MSTSDVQGAWARCVPATRSHGYIRRKGGSTVGLRVVPLDARTGGVLKAGYREWLVLPLYSIATDALISLQFIAPPVIATHRKENGKATKMTAEDVKLGDAAFTVGTIDPVGTVYVCEGIGQAWSCNRATGDAAVTCCGIGRFMVVSMALRKRYPDARLVIVPDVGPDALDCAERAATEVGAKIIDMPAGRPNNFDVNDLMLLPATEGGGVEALKALLGKPREPSVRAWRELDPLPELTISAPEPFPFDGLGETLGNAAKAIAKGVQVPDALAAGSVLAAASLATQIHADVQLPHALRPLVLFIITGAESGDRKSACDDVATAAADEVRNEQARRYAEALANFDDAMANRGKRDRRPRRPVAQSLIVSKATVEGLAMMLRNQSSIGVFTSEGAELLGGHSMREERRSAGLAWFLKAWDGATLQELTKAEGNSVLLGRRISMHVMAQPIVLHELLNDPLAKGQGFLARCLISVPSTLAGDREWQAWDSAEDEDVKRFQSTMKYLLEAESQVAPGGDGYELKLPFVQLSHRALAAWKAFYNEVEAAQAEGAPLQGVRAFASKAAEQAGRIGGVITVFSDDEPERYVSGRTMAGAIKVVRWYLGEHVRVTGASTEKRRLSLLHSLLAWIEGHYGGTVKHSVLLRSAPNAVRVLKADGINDLLDELAQRGYIRRRGDAWESRS